jgi:hypothetical protein
MEQTTEWTESHQGTENIRSHRQQKRREMVLPALIAFLVMFAILFCLSISVVSHLPIEHYHNVTQNVTSLSDEYNCTINLLHIQGLKTRLCSTCTGIIYVSLCVDGSVLLPNCVLFTDVDFTILTRHLPKYLELERARIDQNECTGTT